MTNDQRVVLGAAEVEARLCEQVMGHRRHGLESVAGEPREPGGAGAQGSGDAAAGAAPGGGERSGR